MERIVQRSTALMAMLVVLMVALVGGGDCAPPDQGPYEIQTRDYDVDTLQRPFAQVVVSYPVTGDAGRNNGTLFPFLVFAHGLGGGGAVTEIAHIAMMRSLSSHGFIVAAVKSCNVGCADGGWDTYWEEQVKVITWSQTPEVRADPILGQIDHALGYGIFGHSMGGQATGRSATRAAQYRIKAALLLHAFADAGEDIGADITIPLAAFTGTDDYCCGESSARQYWDEAPAPKTLANAVSIGHQEPNLPNNIWRAYIVAWFKIWLLNDRKEFYSLIYDQANPDSLCTFFKMETCIHENL